MKNKKILIIIIGFIVLMAAAYLLYSQLSDKYQPNSPETTTSAQVGENAEQTTQKPKTPAPDFTVYDVTGSEVKLSDYFGKPIVLNFWASWCGPCKSEMPEFNKKYLELNGEVTFLMVNLTTGRETLSSAKNYVTEQGFSFPVLYDKNGDAGNVYQTYSIPATYFIDKDGNIAAQAVGALSEDRLQSGIDLIK